MGQIITMADPVEITNFKKITHIFHHHHHHVHEGLGMFPVS
jgi:hypothetical protein